METQNKQGIIYAPYIMVESIDGPSKEYKEFMDWYDSEHKLCPKCGSTGHTTTLVAYVLDMYDKEKYKDLNKCKCTNCGNVHITHERTPIK